jgi:hypothetical protein
MSLERILSMLVSLVQFEENVCNCKKKVLEHWCHCCDVCMCR